MSEPIRVANKSCRATVQARIPFKGSNLFGEAHGDSYIVYSYGRHWPLVIYHQGEWFVNEDKYSSSTSRQLSYARPWHVDTIAKTTEEMKALRNRIVNA